MFRSLIRNPPFPPPPFSLDRAHFDVLKGGYGGGGGLPAASFFHRFIRAVGFWGISLGDCTKCIPPTRGKPRAPYLGSYYLSGGSRGFAADPS